MIKEAYYWYENRQQGLGEKMLVSLDFVYQKLESHPEYFSIIRNQYRQIKLSVFPYVIVYEILNDKVIVFAFFHTTRNPSTKI